MGDRGCPFDSGDRRSAEAGDGRQHTDSVGGGCPSQSIGFRVLETLDLGDFEVLGHTYQPTGLSEIAGHVQFSSL
ncbi:hypothetical protein BHE74_00057286 [Ensete ventricosum]|nr:hypothetical protein BHE74_00057286 [Ensete ventricosum]